MEEFLETVVTYMATATDDEYEEIAQTIPARFWCTVSMDRMLKTLSAISQIRLTAAVWNRSCRRPYHLVFHKYRRSLGLEIIR